ncbi:MAG: hypothetical protein ACI4OL_09090 [Gemmiger sp.]
MTYRPKKKGSIDVPLTGPKRPGSGFNLGAQKIRDEDLEIVNRHHREVKELHRRAREQAEQDACFPDEAWRYKKNG